MEKTNTMANPLHVCHVENTLAQKMHWIFTDLDIIIRLISNYQFRQIPCVKFNSVYIIKGWNTNIEDNSFPCELCGKYYKSKGSLATHISLLHGKNEPDGQIFSCFACGKQCTSKSALNTHKSRYHKTL